MNDKNGFSTLLAVLITAVIVGVLTGVISYSYAVSKKDLEIENLKEQLSKAKEETTEDEAEETITTSPSTPSVSSTPSLITDETTNWKTYANDKYGFNFKYPGNLDIKATMGMQNYIDTVKVSYVKFESYEIGSDNAFLKIIFIPTSTPKEGGESGYESELNELKNLKTSNIVVGGKQATKNEGDDFGRYEGDSAGKVINILINKNIWIHYEEKPAGQKVNTDTEKLFNQILSTFQFMK